MTYPLLSERLEQAWHDLRRKVLGGEGSEIPAVEADMRAYIDAWRELEKFHSQDVLQHLFHLAAVSSARKESHPPAT